MSHIRRIEQPRIVCENRRQFEGWEKTVRNLAVVAALGVSLAILVNYGPELLDIANTSLHFVTNGITSLDHSIDRLMQGYADAPNVDLFSAWVGGHNPGAGLAVTASSTNHEFITQLQNLSGLDGMKDGILGQLGK